MKTARSIWLQAHKHPVSAWEPRAIARRAVWVLLPLVLLGLLVIAVKRQVFPTNYPWRLMYVIHDDVWLPVYGHTVSRFGNLGLVGLGLVLFCLFMLMLVFILGRSPLDGLHLAVIRKALRNRNYHGFLLTGDGFGRSLGLDKGMIGQVVSRECERLTWHLSGRPQGPRNAAAVMDLAACLRLEWTLLGRQDMAAKHFRLRLVAWYRALVLIRDAQGGDAASLLRETLSAFHALAGTVKRHAEAKDQLPTYGGIDSATIMALDDLLLRSCLDLADRRDPLLDRALAQATTAGCDLLVEIETYLQRAAHLGFPETPTMLTVLTNLETQIGLTNWARIWLSVVIEAADRRSEPGLLLDALERMDGLRLLFDFLEPVPMADEEETVQQQEALTNDTKRATEPSPTAHMWQLLDKLLTAIPDAFSYQQAARLSRHQARYQQQQWQAAPILAGGFLRVEDFTSLEADSESFLLAAGPVQEYKHGHPTFQSENDSGRP